MLRVVSGRAFGVKPKAKSSCESQKQFPYRIGWDPGQQRPPAVLLTYRVLLEIGLLLVEDKEEKKGNWYKNKQTEKRNVRSVSLKFGTLNVGRITGKSRELADMLERRKVKGQLESSGELHWSSRM